MRFALFLHLVSMATWLGGQLFLVLVALPALRGTDPDQRQDTLRRVGMAFGVVSIPLLLVLLATGGWMMAEYDMDPGERPELRHKLELVGVVLAGVVVHSVAGAKRMRRLSRTASMVTLAATLGVVWFATGI